MLNILFVFAMLAPLAAAAQRPKTLKLADLQEAIRSKNCDVLHASLQPMQTTVKKYEKYVLLFTGLNCHQLPQAALNDLQARIEALQWTDNEKVIFASELANYHARIALKTEDRADDLIALEERFAVEKNSRKKEALIQEALKIAQELKAEDAILRIQRALYLTSPRFDPEMEEKNPLLVARNYRNWREFDSALKIYKKIYENPETPPEKKLEALREKRHTIKSQQQRKKVLEVDEEIVRFVQNQLESQVADLAWFQKSVDVHLTAARALWTEGQLSSAQAMIHQQIKNLEGKTNIDEFYFLHARMSEEKKDFEESLKFYDLIYKKDGDQSLYRRTLWAKGWINFKLKDLAKAESIFADFAKIAEEPNEKMRGLFWRAEALKRSKKIKQARVIYQQISVDDPFGYYGILAHRELKSKFLPFKKPKANLQLEKSFRSISAEKAEVIQKLMDLHLKENLEIALAQFKPDLDLKISNLKLKDSAKKKRAIEELELAYMLSYARAGLYLPLFSTTAALKPEERNRILNMHPEILFPTDYIDVISPAASTFQLDPEFILSIIRQESAFNPLAKSHAEAYGLMQMLPAVATEYKKKAGVDFKDATDLFDPQINVAVGSSFLSDLYHRKWNNQLIPSIASYNASQKAVQNWIDTRFDGDVLTFIEEVPYEETRGYIKLVLRNYVLYKRRLNPKAFSFPDHFLDLRLPEKLKTKHQSKPADSPTI